jgi:hypothetical protein
MNQQDNIERIRKRELRALYRTKRMEQEQAARKMKAETMSKKACINERAIEVLREDNKKPEKPDKKPGAGKFLEVYSYIPSTGYDSRYCIPSSWKPQSFNERKQHLEFLKRFVYPYPLPEMLIWSTHTPQYSIDENGNKVKSVNFGKIRLYKKWIADIVSGQSFYKRNREFFTKAEAHYFLCSKVPYVDCYFVITLYFYAKCRARSMNHKLSMTVADVFSLKFFNCFRHSLVEGFLDMIARTQGYRFENGMLGDLCDFVLDKIGEKRKNSFSFSGRNIFSVIGLSNEWHECQRREADAARHQTLMDGKPIDTSHWKGLGISQFKYETEESLWTVTELRTANDLINEGRKMRNCVSSYAFSCASGKCSIFSVECFYPANRLIEKAATLEVTSTNRTLVQAKGKCNTALSSKAMNVISRWAAFNNIKVRVKV